MKLADRKSRIQALFRAPNQEPDKAPNPRHTMAAVNDHQRVEIRIPSTGERFVHVPSPSRPGDLQHTSEETSLDLPEHDAELKRSAAEGLQRWDGQSVRDIDTERFYEYPDLETHTALQASVPIQARDQFWNPAPRDQGYRSSITVLAIDQMGEALVKEYVVDDSRNADGWSYSVMSADRAAQHLRDYGAAPDLKLHLAGGLLQGERAWQHTAIGETYRGPIHSIKGDTAYQLIDQERFVEHRVDALAIRDPQQYVGKEVEISYPCGQVGLVLQLDAAKLQHAQHSLENARRDHSLER
ncbi:hypothetical protein DAI43_17205 [Achromobacter xylosoxidans]|uniref:KfrB domain-containing protein n=1 Tax=Achromobacter aegrifaciens TaxID=1287736 RepID=UPI000D4A2367|nr:hypothetical protein [Achromobacter aegrifaciens]MDQ1758253.1 hypothetical protein [Achromobacter aegrifaciens]PTN50397.1 hypothetical protein DAI43_17205 [Achromobacter xylosoxidans]